MNKKLTLQEAFEKIKKTLKASQIEKLSDELSLVELVINDYESLKFDYEALKTNLKQLNLKNN